MNYMVNWIQENWLMVLVIFAGQSGVLTPTVLGIIRIVTKRLNQKANNARLSDMVNVIRMERNTSKLILSGMELLINNVGSETIRKHYQHLKETAAATETEIEARLNDVAGTDGTFVPPENILKRLKLNSEVDVIDTNKTSF